MKMYNKPKIKISSIKTEDILLISELTPCDVDGGTVAFKNSWSDQALFE